MKDSRLVTSRGKFRSLLERVPKTEIHLHLEALVSVDTLWKLIGKHGISIEGVKSKADLRRKFEINSLDEFIDVFINIIQNCFQHVDDLDLLLEDAKNYLIRNNIRYAEIFFAPTKFIMSGIEYPQIVDRLDEGAARIERESGSRIRYIMDISRTYGVENAKQNLDLVLGNPRDTIIGIGLGGSEAKGPARDFADLFKEARESGYYVVAHAGEDVGPESVWDALKYLHAERIGHGISAINDQSLMDTLKETQIPLEICPTSNLFTKKFVRTLKEHPIRHFYDFGMMVTVNTDDPTLFGIDLIDEYMKLFDEGIFTAKEIIQLIKNNLYSTFMPLEDKDAIWEEAKEQLDVFLNAKAH